MAFIDVDIEKLLNEDGWVNSILDQGPAIQKRVQLYPMQMRMFNVLDITKLPDGTIWLDFLSEKYAPTKEAMDFIYYCTQLWGKDSAGRGAPCDADVKDLRNGTYCRTWDNVKMLQIKRPGDISLTIALRIIIDNPDINEFIRTLKERKSCVNVNQEITNKTNVKGAKPESTPGQHHHTATQQTTLTPNGEIINKPFDAGKILLLVLISAILFPIGSIGVVIYGIVRFFDKTTKIKWYNASPRKGGMRAGDATKRISTVAANPDVIAINKKNGIIAIVIGISIGLILGLILSYQTT